MTLIIPNGFVNVIMRWTSPNLFKGTGVTQFGMNLDFVPGDNPAETVADLWSETIRPLQSSSMTLADVTVQTATQSVTEEVGLSGGISSTPAEPSIAVLTKKVTGVRGPRAKGRAYWPGMAYEGTFDAKGLMSESDRTEYQQAFDAFMDGLQTVLGTMVILQNEEGETPPLSPPPEVPTLVVDPRAATQRRRLRS